MPSKTLYERERQASSGVVPLPATRIVRLRLQGGIIAEQSDEERVTLHLARQRMRGDERVRRLEVGAGREYDDVVGTLRRNAARDEEQRPERHR